MVIMSTKINNSETKMIYKVCLIVDNPIRDLEGIILIAWHLAKKKYYMLYSSYVLSGF